LTEKNRIDNDFGVKIFQYKSEVLYYIHSEWYVLDHVTDVLKKHDLFNKHFKGISEIIPIDDTSFGILKDNLLYIINQNEQSFSWKLIAPKYYEGKIVNNDTRIFNFNHQYLLNLDDGFLLFETNKNDFAKQSIIIEAYLNEELIENETKIPYNQSLELHFLSDFYGNKKSPLFYRQNGSELIPLIDGKLALNNLTSGQNKIEVFYTNGVDYVKANEFSFYVKKPWYLSFWMIILYLSCIAIILFVYYRWNKIRYQEKLKLKEEELKHHKQIVELELEAENKLKIQDYEKHILEMQIQSKATELAGKSLSIAKQGEMIENIQRILEQENEVMQLKNKIRKVIKINALNKKEWESFEKNIYQSHDEFVQRLSKRYPQLTSKDIRLCIYLKMNLSSKEIAPLMNISYRGVELHRYRLRKKINLDADVNLSTFMINL
jgi:DNA-binding CsgD family transcriptional regulator